MTIMTESFGIKSLAKITTASGGNLKSETLGRTSPKPFDVAVGLSNTCVYPERSIEFYSHAQRAVILSNIAEADHGLVAAQFALAKFAHIAFIGVSHDFPMSNYWISAATISNSIMKNVFRIPEECRPIAAQQVDQIERQLHVNEMRDVTVAPVEGNPIADIEIKAAIPSQARQWYIDRWEELIAA